MDQAYGATLGACCGDAAGAVLEFINKKPLRSEVEAAMRMCGGGHHAVAPGQITDDGELTMCLARGLSKCNGVFNADRIAEEYAAWFKSKPFDVGTTTFMSIGAAVRGEANSQYRTEVLEKKGYAYAMNWGATSSEAKFSKANGSLMRATPLGIFGHKLQPNQIAEIARADSSLSHPNETCINAVACYSIAIAHLINHKGDNRGAFDAAKAWITEHANENEVCSWLRDAENNVDEPYVPNAGFIKIGFIHAFRHLFNNTPFEAAIAETLAGGGDSDTNACIVGGLVGALHGESAIPNYMKNPVLTCDTKSGRTRPDFLSPKHLRGLVAEIMDKAPS